MNLYMVISTSGLFATVRNGLASTADGGVADVHSMQMTLCSIPLYTVLNIMHYREPSSVANG